MKDRFQTLRSKLSGRVALAAALGAVGLAAAGTALAADDKSTSDSNQQGATMPMPPGPPGLEQHGFAIGFAGPGDDAVSDDFAQELSDHLDGVSADEISTALSEIADEHEADRRAEMADQLAAELDGVDADAIADALQVAEDKMRSSFEDGDVPDPGLFTQTLADELGIDESEITDALEATSEKAFSEHGSDAAYGPGPIGAPGMPGGFGPPPGAEGGFTMPAPPPAPGSSPGNSGSGSSSQGSNN